MLLSLLSNNADELKVDVPINVGDGEGDINHAAMDIATVLDEVMCYGQVVLNGAPVIEYRQG